MPEMKSEASLTKQLFVAAGILRVVFVDDRFGMSTERIQAEADKLELAELQGCGAFSAVNFASDNDAVKRDAIRKVIEEASATQLEMMFDQMAALTYEYDAAEKDRDARNYFENVVGEAAETKYLSLKQWEKTKTELLEEATAKPTLFIFDEDFTLEGESSTHGRKLINQIHSANPGYKYVYALLTHNASDDTAELDLHKNIVENSPEIAEYVLVFAKNRLANDGHRFAERMKQLLLMRLFQALKRRLKAETEEASRDAMAKIEGLGIESFERIILNTSRIEGAWSPDTFVRVIGVYQQQQVSQNIRKNAELHQFVRDIDPICEVKTPLKNDEVTKDAQSLQHDEIYETGERVNLVHLPLASGDIFRDDAGQEYILLAQPCDLMVRSKGYRRNGDRDSRQTVPLAPIKILEKPKDISIPSGQYELLHYDTKAQWAVRLNEVYYLPIWLLDLAVLNDDGRCSVSEGDAMSLLLISPWIKRRPILVEWAAVVAKAESEAAHAALDKNALVQSYCRIPLGSPFVAEVTRASPDDPQWRLTLKLTRVSRVAEQYATAVLIEHAAYMARLAHPHDLTRLK
jgi:hypothetical protein